MSQPASSELSWLDVDALVHVLRCAGHPRDICRAYCAARLLQDPAVQALRLRAVAAGRAVPAGLLIEGSSWMQWLLLQELHARTCMPPFVSCGVLVSAFVSAGGQLLTAGTQGVPRAVTGLTAVRVRMVAVGYNHTLAVSDIGSVYSFGDNGRGQLGHPIGEDSAPRLIDALLGVRVTAVAAGFQHSLVVGDGGAYSFGGLAYGKLGHGDDSDLDRGPPRRIESLGGRICAVAAGGQHSLALNEAGEVFSFGRGDMGQLGHGGPAAERTPRRIEVSEGRWSLAIAIAAGNAHSLVVSAAGSVFAFGAGAFGLTPDVDATRYVPRVVPSLRGIRTVVTRGFYSLALTEDGRVYAFGALEGTGEDLRSAPSPRLLPGLRRVRAIEAGACTGVAVDSDGAVFGWGDSQVLRERFEGEERPGQGRLDARSQWPPRRLALAMELAASTSM